MTINLWALVGAVSMFVLTIIVFSLWFDRHTLLADSCLARMALFVMGFGTGFLAFWAFQPSNLTDIVCIGPLIGLGVGGYTEILMPTIVSRVPERPQTDNRDSDSA